jgi:hypothetical protein
MMQAKRKSDVLDSPAVNTNPPTRVFSTVRVEKGKGKRPSFMWATILILHLGNIAHNLF